MDWVKRNDEYDISPQPCCQPRESCGQRARNAAMGRSND